MLLTKYYNEYYTLDNMCIVRILASSKIRNLLQIKLNLSLIYVHKCTYTSANSPSLRSFQPENHHNDVHNPIYIYICGTYVSWKVVRQLQKFHWHARRRFINGRVITKLFYLSTENNDKIDRIFVYVTNRGKWTEQHVLLTRGDRVRVQVWGRGTSIG